MLRQTRFRAGATTAAAALALVVVACGPPGRAATVTPSARRGTVPERSAGRPAVIVGVVAPVGGRVLRRFAPPATPFGRGHRGVDLAARPGEVVRAALAGVVTFAGPVAGVQWVTVTHDGELRTTYGGLTPSVHSGDHVRLGQPLGRATAVGRVDWGARRGDAYIDPLGLLGGWRVRLVAVAS